MFAFSNGEIQIKTSEAVADSRANSQRFNKNGVIDSAEITACRWRPQASPTATNFAVAHKNGKVYLYDRNRADPAVGSPARWHTNKGSRVSINVDQSANPTMVWDSSPGGQAVNALSFSPDGSKLAAAVGDGRIWVMDVVHGYVVGSGITYFGKALCVCWSDDGRYLASGGEDDLITLWRCHPEGLELCARGEAHTSWVTQVAFHSREDKTYRFASVGLDARWSSTLCHVSKLEAESAMIGIGP